MGNLDIHIGEILARNGRMYPNGVALIERLPNEKKRVEITWKEFDERANRFANALISKGIKKGDKIIHLMMNSIDWLVAYFGIVRTGAWAVPLNFRFMDKDIEYCCGVAEPRCMVFGEEFTERIDRIKDHLPTVKDYIFVGKEIPSYAEPFGKLLENASPGPPNVDIKHDDPAASTSPPGPRGRRNPSF